MKFIIAFCRIETHRYCVIYVDLLNVYYRFFFIYVYKNILESIVTKLRYALLLTVQFIIFSCACFSIEKYIILYSLINVAPIIGNSRIAISTWSPDRTVVLRLVTSYVPQNNHVQLSLIYFPL